MNLTEFKKSEEAKKPHYLLLGHPVDHSWSPLMHNTALKFYGMDARYHAIDLQNQELTDLAAFLNQEHLLGANVTIPYKQQITAYLDFITSSANEIGAINTIVKRENRLNGYNTDCHGFLAPIKEFEAICEGSSAVIFGTGGASRAIVVALKKMGMEAIYLVSRTPNKISSFGKFDRVNVVSYDNWTSWAEKSTLIVNATPLGMHPETDKSPVRSEEHHFLADHICYDIVYNPVKTKFLQQAEQVGATTINGLEMLIQQGSRSFELWTGKPFPIKLIRDTLYERLAD